MNRNQAIAAGIKPATFDNEEIDFGRLVVAEEFSRKEMPFTPKIDYRERAWKRLIASRRAFRTDYNISDTAFRELVTVRCPHCSGEMEWNGGSGSGNASTNNYICRSEACGTRVNITLHVPGAIYVEPKGQREF
jgi:hypothetical protein